MKSASLMFLTLTGLTASLPCEVIASLETSLMMAMYLQWPTCIEGPIL